MKALVLVSVMLCGCATIKLTDQIDGNYRNPNGELGKPHPYYIAILPIAIVFDIATFPLQMFWIGSQL